MKRLLYILLFILFVATSVSAQKIDMTGCVFEKRGFHTIRLEFVDGKYCELTQSFSIPYPNGFDVRKERFQYHYSKEHIVLISSVPGSNNAIWRECVHDFYALGFVFPNYIERDACLLEDYPLEPISPGISVTMAECCGYWYHIGKKVKCAMVSPSIIYVPNLGLLPHTKGNLPQLPIMTFEKNIPDFPPELSSFKFGAEYKWYERESVVVDSDVTMQDILYHEFIYAKDTLCFVDSALCVMRSPVNTTRSYSYHVEGANVVIANELSSVGADTLVYKDMVLYSAIVTQTLNEQTYVEKPFYGILDCSRMTHTPSAEVDIRAFVRKDAMVDDDQIGTTFQKIYFPINFHLL